MIENVLKYKALRRLSQLPARGKDYLMTRTNEPLEALSSVTELPWVFSTQTWMASNA